jgi:hypothetical protein
MPNGHTTITQTARAAEKGPQTFGSSRKKQGRECWQFAQWLCDHWYTAAVRVRFARGICPIPYATVGEVEAES